MKKILIVEDEEITAIALEEFLNSIGYIVTNCVNSATEAYKSIQRELPDLVLTDVMLIGQKTGCELARDIFEKYGLPIVFLTAYYDDEILELAKFSRPFGYIIKPYKEDELKATLQLALHKAAFEKQNSHYTPHIKLEKYLYNLEKKELYLNMQKVHMGPKSRDLLYLLVKNANQVVTYEVLINYIWGNANENIFDKLRHLVKRLKEKLDLESIQSVKNIGYILRNSN